MHAISTASSLSVWPPLERPWIIATINPARPQGTRGVHRPRPIKVMIAQCCPLLAWTRYMSATALPRLNRCESASA
jgi:hypothetical protein